jgi:hypothetical protein
MGPDGVQRTPCKRGLIYEHPAQQYRRIHRPEEYGELGTSAHKVSQDSTAQAPDYEGRRLPIAKLECGLYEDSYSWRLEERC